MKKKKINKNFPEGAISGNTINKINEVYLSRVFDDDGPSDLMPVLVPLSEGKILDLVGQKKKAIETFQGILKKNPKNRWVKAALKEAEGRLH